MDYAEFYQNRLYPLQDKVLKVINQVAPDFYLTGGTALSRFYLRHRYSEDLDFFVNRHKKFKELTNNIAKGFEGQFQKFRVQLSDTDFQRLFVYEKDTELKIELINDVGYHFKSTEKKNKLHLDSWQNVLSNKVCALSRNATKDYADILFLALRYAFNWVEIYNAAKSKDTWVNEIASAQLIDEFDIKRLSEIKWMNESMDINKFSNHFHIIAKDILMAADNSLFNNKYCFLTAKRQRPKANG